MKTYRFEEPHCTGGSSTVDITEEQILKYMKEEIIPKFQDKYPKDISDECLIEDFATVHWAWLIGVDKKI